MLRVLRYSSVLNYGVGLLAVCAAIPFLWPGLAENLLASGRGAESFMTHYHCYLEIGPLVAMHFWSDLLIGLSYVAISLTLTYLVYRSRRDIPFHWVFIAFGLFIIACGSTHFMEVWTTYNRPVYWLAGYLKLITAVASVATAVVLPPLVPRTLALVRSAKLSELRRQELERANRELEDLYGKIKELDELKTQFFANVSHELRTPLALILGPTQKLLTAGGLDDTARRDVEMIERNARMLLKHVNDLLDISKLEAGKMRPVYTRIDLARLLRLTGAFFESSARERDIDFSLEAPATLPAEADPEKLQRVLINLLSNAFKFTPDGGVVRCALKEAAGARARFEVRDSGAGVPTEMRRAVFERFRQADGGATRRFGGTGLGLSIVKEFVELHGGTVEVADAPEGGAQFNVELPLAAPPGTQLAPAQPGFEEAARETARQASDTAATERLQSRRDGSARATRPAGFEDGLAAPSVSEHGAARGDDASPVQTQGSGAAAAPRPLVASPTLAPLVLVIEDNVEMNRFVADTLAGEYRVATAFDGREGVEQALETRPDLILCDMMMPDVSGEELVRDLRGRQEFVNTPICILTAKADRESRVKLLRGGVQDYLLKPFVPEELRARVGNLIEMKRTREALQGELESQSNDLTSLAREVTERRRQMQRTLAALRETNRTLEAIVQASPLAIVTLDAAGVVKTWNPAAERIYGWTAREAVGRPLPTVPPERRAEVEANHREAIHGRRFTAFETQRLRKDGTLIDVSISTAPLGDGDAGAGVLAIVEDITARKESEKRLRESQEALRASEERYRAFVEQSAEPIWRAEFERPMPLSLPEDEQIEYFYRHSYLAECNDVMARMYGYGGAHEMVGKRFGELLPRNPQNVEYLRRVIRSGYRVSDQESQEVDRQGRTLYFLNNLVGIIERGQLLRVWGTQRDITARREAEEQLVRSRERLALAQRAGNIGTFDWDIRTGALTWTAELEAIFGLPPGGFGGTFENWRERVLPEDLGRCEEGIRAALESRSPDWQAEYRISRADTGELRWIDARSRVFYDEQGRPARMIGINLDITRRKQFEQERERLLAREQAMRSEAERASRAKDEFLATLSHELRTPLTPIIGWVHMLGGGRLSQPDLAHGLAVIDKNAQALARLINDLLDMSAILNNKMRIVRAPVELDEVIREAVETVRPQAQRRRVEVEFAPCPDGGDHAALLGDRTRLVQVFWNLIDNAVKFSPEGGSVRVLCERDAGGVRVHVEDEGAGLAPDVLPRVFERFWQADMSTTKAHGGLGIGLALVKSFVEAHGGTVGAASAGVGRGSRFTVSLPLELRNAECGMRNESSEGMTSPPSSEPPSVKASHKPPSPGQQQSAIRNPQSAIASVLVVEDAPDTLELLRVSLGARGYDVTACASAEEALRVAGARPFDIIISDIGLPNTSGHELLRQVRSAHPALERVPAVALTGYAAQRDVELALAAGFDAHLAKPFDPAQLIEQVEALLRGRPRA